MTAAARLINAIRIPPINSHFHAIMSTIIKQNDGILCMMRQINLSMTGTSPSKQSIENIIIKRIARMPMILGDQ
jgi:hypothetical protein